jgi:hypothetical protein
VKFDVQDENRFYFETLKAKVNKPLDNSRIEVHSLSILSALIQIYIITFLISIFNPSFIRYYLFVSSWNHIIWVTNFNTILKHSIQNKSENFIFIIKTFEKSGVLKIEDMTNFDLNYLYGYSDNIKIYSFQTINVSYQSYYHYFILMKNHVNGR